MLHRCAREFQPRAVPALAAARPNAYDRAVNARDAALAVEGPPLRSVPPAAMPTISLFYATNLNVC